MSLGWQVLAAARARDSGADINTILARVDQVRKKLIQIVCLDTLEYLQRGGRIGEAARWVGGLLHVKPIVSINHQTGVVQALGLARTHKSAVEMMYSHFFNSLKGGKNLRVAVLHGNAPVQAEELAERIRAEFNPIELLINITGPVLGMNTGPGALALCGYAED
jgi:DegV family protein with EDD domain